MSVRRGLRAATPGFQSSLATGALHCAVTGLVVLALIAVVLAPMPAWAQRSVSLIRDAETETMIRGYADPILVAAGIQPESVRIYLVNDGSVNAFVTVGRRMFLNTGLILAAENPNEIIGVIAHEAGHIAGAHVARIGDAAASAATPALVTMGLGLIAALAGAPQAGLALMMGGQQIAQRQILAYSRVQESSADQAGVTYLDSIGVSSEGMIGFFEKFRDQEVLSAHRQDPFIRTHPLSSERINALRSRVAESPHTGKEDSPEAKHQLRMVQAKIYGFLEEPAVTFRRFPASDDSAPARYARTVAHFRRGDVDKALDEIAPLIAAEPDNPYFHELHGQVLFETGRPAEAVAPYRTAMRLRPNQPLFKLMYGQALLAMDDDGTDKSLADDARRYLSEAARTEGENSFVWHQLAIAHARLGNEPMADLATAERYYIGGNFGGAFRFAARARQGLPPGTPEWNRANDILQFSQSEARDRRR